MRIYEGSHRQDWEEVLRSIGADLDDRGLRDVVFLETDTGFVVQGVIVDASVAAWGEGGGIARKETIILADEDAAAFMDRAVAHRGDGTAPPYRYEHELRLIGRYLDERKPRDVFFFEQDGAYVVRVAIVGQAGLKHELIEFTRGDIEELEKRAPTLRRAQAPAGR
jgi:hypothetical protein